MGTNDIAKDTRARLTPGRPPPAPEEQVEILATLRALMRRFV